jgi:hypothetical protein
MLLKDFSQLDCSPVTPTLSQIINSFTQLIQNLRPVSTANSNKEYYPPLLFSPLQSSPLLLLVHNHCLWREPTETSQKAREEARTRYHLISGSNFGQVAAKTKEYKESEGSTGCYCVNQK